MTQAFSKKSRQSGVLFNYIIVIMFLILFCLGEYRQWNPWLIVGTILLFLAAILSYIHVYIRTGLWKMTRSKSEDLDEREIAIVHDAYRHAYNIFTVACLVLLFFVFLTVRYSFFTLTSRGHYSFGLILLIFLNYLVNTLPVTIVAWREPVVEK